MQYCSDCYAVEGGTIDLTDEEKLKEGLDLDEEYLRCAVCGMEDTMINVDEDAGKDR